MLLQQISKNVRLNHQVESTTFNYGVDVTNKCNLMKDYVKNANIRSSKGKPQNTNNHLNQSMMTLWKNPH